MNDSQLGHQSAPFAGQGPHPVVLVDVSSGIYQEQDQTKDFLYGRCAPRQEENRDYTGVQLVVCQYSVPIADPTTQQVCQYVGATVEAGVPIIQARYGYRVYTAYGTPISVITPFEVDGTDTLCPDQLPIQQKGSTESNPPIPQAPYFTGIVDHVQRLVEAKR